VPRSPFIVRKLLLQLDSSPAPSVFDRIVALDAGADEVMSYGNVTPDGVRDFVHGCLFTRGPKELHNTAIFIGGTDMAAGERLLSAVLKVFFGPFQVSVMLDSNGSNTTAAAAVLRLQQAVGDLQGRRAVVVAGSGPVGMRAAGLLAKAGAVVTVTSRKASDGALAERIAWRFGGSVQEAMLSGPADAPRVLEGAELLLTAGPPGVTVVPQGAWRDHPTLRAAVDLNAVPPLGIEGIAVTDSAAVHGATTVFGALGAGSLKMKIHRACIARLFERNDLALDAETIAAVGRELVSAQG
jgi:methylenetetrahydrofolate/methylenetetrahydromethanopterin dehydrogenase (NADP+)